MSNIMNVSRLYAGNSRDQFLHLEGTDYRLHQPTQESFVLRGLCFAEVDHLEGCKISGNIDFTTFQE